MKFWLQGAGVVAFSIMMVGCAGLTNGSGAPVEGSNASGQNGQVQSQGINGPASFSGNSYGESNLPAGASALPKTVYFPFNSFGLNSKAQQVAKENVAYLLKHPKVTVVLAGNTDPRGSQEYNFHLGQRRANAVLNYFLSEGVPQSQMCTVSYGELRPATSPTQFGGSWKKAYSLDRRTEILYGQTCQGSSA